MNSVLVVGTVGRDAEIKYFESGKSKTSYSLAVNRWDSKTKAEVTDWFNIDDWDKAELAYQHAKKGTLLWVDGRLTVNKYNGKEYYSIISSKFKVLRRKAENM